MKEKDCQKLVEEYEKLNLQRSDMYPLLSKRLLTSDVVR